MLSGKNAIITGSRKGIGRSITEEFAKNGANIWACARAKDATFETDMAELSSRYGVSIKPLYFDLTDSGQLKAAVRQIRSEKCPVDILVNNAGVPFGGTLHMTPVEKLREVFETNFFSQIELTQLITRFMMRQKSGVVINIASVGGIESGPGYLAYGSSKAALIYATKTMSHELGEYGIRVNAIAPGLTDTQMGAYKSDEETRKVLERSSLHRMGRPEEIAACAAFLASDRASFITGQVLVADGGRLWV